MDSALFYWTIPFLTLLVSILVSYRLGYFFRGETSGRGPFFAGALLLLSSIIWFSIVNLSDYSTWFVTSAYPIIEVIHFLAFITGFILLTIGLVFYADFWQSKKEELKSQEQKLTLLSELQKDAREPYHLMELFNIALKDIVSRLEETSGAIFLFNKNQKQLVLASTAGLSKQETASLEQYPIGQNVITQAIELADPIISGEFHFVTRDKNILESKFKSTLILPLISGQDKIGAIVLLSEESQFFSNSEIRFLGPIAEWLAEKVKSTRLTRELSLLKKDSEERVTLQKELNQRLIKATDSLTRQDAVSSFCTALEGVADSATVHLIGLLNGSLHFFGGSEPLMDLSENYKTALLEALDKKKPLIINQESESEDGRTFITKSTLIIPSSNEQNFHALMLTKESNPFRISDEEIKNLESYANLAKVILHQSELRRINISRRKGFEKVVQLLRFDIVADFISDPTFFNNHIFNALPPKTNTITAIKNEVGVYQVIDAHASADLDLSNIRFLPTEGVIGDVTASMKPLFVYGRTKIESALESLDTQNRSAMQSVFGEKGRPQFLAFCPLFDLSGIVGLSILAMYGVSEEEKGEWEKLLTLASGLYSVRLTINQLRKKKVEVVNVDSAQQSKLGETVNRLNNHLSAIIGNAELITLREDITGDIKNHFQTIINETELAAQYLKDALGKFSTSDGTVSIPKQKSLNSIIEDLLNKNHISDRTFLYGGSPREIVTKFNDDRPIEIAEDIIISLLQETLNRFASTMDDDDIITIKTYVHGKYCYCDISRHHKNFPAVDDVSRFGEYKTAAEIVSLRPTDRFLEHIRNENCFYTYDKLSVNPSYLSFKFPTGSLKLQKSEPVDKIKILAIDDQTVILDLIKAMCLSLGYNIDLAENGEIGEKLALENDYDLILTDLAMPGKSGIEVATVVHREKPHIPILLITGWEVDLSDEKLNLAGISKVLYKPFRIEQLTEEIQSFFHAKSQS